MECEDGKILVKKLHFMLAYGIVVRQPEGVTLQKIPPIQVIGDFGRGSSVESESE